MRFFLHYFVAAHSQMLMYAIYTLGFGILRRSTGYIHVAVRFSNAPRLVLKKKLLLFIAGGI